MTLYNSTEITLRYVFGTSNPSSKDEDYNSHIRNIGAVPQPKAYNMLTYLTLGGGRYAFPSLFPIINKFFDYPFPIANGVYSYNQIIPILGLTTGNHDFLKINQYGTDIGNFDHNERSYIFGTTDFRLNRQNILFSVVDGYAKSVS
jgi:hypothetical protein